MTKFRQIDDSFYKQAGEAIDASRPSGAEYPEYDSADLVAAAAAVALERGAPNLMAKSYETAADRYLHQGTREWRALHGAVARFIETDLNESEAISSRGDGVRMVVADVLQTVSAGKVVQAAGNKDLEAILNAEQMELMKMSRESIGFLKDMSSISRGDFSSVSDEVGTSLKSSLDGPVPGRLGQEVSLLSRAVDGIVDRDEALSERASAREGGFGQFSPISDRSFRVVEEFHRDGKSSGDEALDATMKLLADQGHMKGTYLSQQEPIFVAQARLHQEGATGVSQAPADLASMALSDVAIMNAARADFMEDSVDSTIKGEGAYHLLDEGQRASIERQIVFGLKTTAVDKVRLEVGMLENSGIAGLDRAHTRAKQEAIDPALAEDVAKAAGAVMDRHPEDDAYAFVQMGHMLSDFHHGKRNDRHLVEAAEELTQTMDDRSMSGSAEWEALSTSVDKALGRDQGEPLGRAAAMQALVSEAKANPVIHEAGPDKVSRAQHIAAMNNGMGF